MRYAQRTILTLIAASSLCAPGAAHAGPLLDWWMNKHRPQPVVVAQQPAVAYTQSCCDVSACNTCNTCDTGCNTCTPAYGQQSYGQQGYVQQQVVNYGQTTAYMPNTSYMPQTYMPQTTAYMPPTVAYSPAVGYAAAYTPQYRYRGFFPRYRTAWGRVPVTTYRPVATVSPNTGMAVTALQPCSTYNWQMQRVPVTALNPAYYANAAYAQPMSGAMVMQSAPSSGCSSCGAGGMTSSVSPSPYYSPTPASSVPSGPASTVGPAETAPANIAPSLNPNEINQGASFRRVPDARPSANSVQEKSVVQPVGKPAWELDLGPGVKPVPDPDAPQNDDSFENEPELNHPRDLTAQAPVRRTWDYTPVSWATTETSTSHTATTRALHLQPAPAPEQDQVEWDSSGWKSIAK